MLFSKQCVLIKTSYLQFINSEQKVHNSMFLQQNLFSIYRLIIKTPKIVFLAATFFTIFVAFTQIIYISKISQPIDLSQALLSYMIEKNQQRRSIREKDQSNQTLKNSSNLNNEKNDTISNDFTFLDDSTLLHFRFEQVDKFQIHLNYSYNHSKIDNPFMTLIKNQYLSLLDREANEDYLKKHNIMYDLIDIPIFYLEKPMFAYYFKEDMQKNEIMMSSLRSSFFALQSKFDDYCRANNITDAGIEIDELYLNYYYQSNNTYNWLSINFYQFMTYQFLPSLFLKLIFSCGSIFLIMTANVFIGLLIRYIIFSAFTIFLTVYDKYLIQSGGWMHQYLAILYMRYKQNRLRSIKMIVFFILSNIGMSLLLAFGAYCILTKLILPTLPLLIDDYAAFYLKTIFFVQLFHFIFSRSRTTIKFFPIISSITAFGTLTICSLNRSLSIIMILNINMTFQIIYFIVFALIEKTIVQQNEKGLHGVYCPSYSKPRMLFYAGYDISWQKSLPPIWTYFTSWFDYSYFNQNEKCLLEKDYQLLYGRMLGFNERQEIPQEQQEMRDNSMPHADQPSNQINLIQA